MCLFWGCTAFCETHTADISTWLYPSHNEVVGGILVSLRLSVRLSVCPSVCPASRVRSVAPTVLVGSIPFYTYHQATSEGVSRVKFLAQLQTLIFWQFFIICSFDFVLFWLRIWCESLVWVIMGRRRVSQNTCVLVLLVFHRKKLYL